MKTTIRNQSFLEKESSYVSELKTAGDNFVKQAAIFKKLAILYFEAAKKEENSNLGSLDILEDYVKSSALYNYILNLLRDGKRYKKNNKQIITLQEKTIQRLSRIFINFCRQLRTEKEMKMIPVEQDIIEEYNYTLVTNRYKSKLAKIRKATKKDVADLKFKFGEPSFEEKSILDGKQQEEKINDIVKMHLRIQENMIAYIREIFNASFMILGPPPCQYAVMGFGSLSRGENTPFSDLEFCILIEKEDEHYKEYFKRATYLMYLKTVNLGETIIPGIGAKSLLWFFDEVTPRGFSFDPMLEKACKTPIGSFSPGMFFKFDLIHTPEEMVNLLKLNTEDRDNDRENSQKIELNMPSTLSTAVYITGQEKLADEYHLSVNKVLGAIDKYKLNDTYKESIMYQVIALKALEKDVKKYPITPLGKNKVFNVKQRLYRLPCLLIDDLSLYFCLLANSTSVKEQGDILSFIRISSLFERSILDDKMRKKLKWAISEILLLRLKTYLYYEKQREDLLYGCSPGEEEKKYSDVRKANEYEIQLIDRIIPIIQSLLRKSKSLLKKSQEDFNKIHQESKEEIPITKATGITRITGGTLAVTADNQSLLSNKLIPKFFHPPYFVEIFFVKQNTLFDQLNTAFSLSRGNLKTSPVVVCYDLDGVGNTQVALHYYYHSSEPYPLRCWFAAERLENDYREFCKNFRIPFDEKASFSQISSRVKKWLEEHPGWLLVYNNAKDCSSLAPHLPKMGGDILLTSRYKLEWDQIGGEVVEIELVTEDETIELVKRTLFPDGKPSELDAKEVTSLKELVQELGRLPLALAQAAAYIRESQVTVTQYLAMYRHNPDIILSDQKLLDSDFRLNLVAKTEFITIENLEKRFPLALKFFKVCAYLASNEIPIELVSRLIQALNISEKKPQESIPKNDELLNEILTCLSSFSLVSYQKETRQFRVHHLVQALIRDQDKITLSAEEQFLWRLKPAAIALQEFYQDAYNEGGVDIFLAYQLEPHLQAVSDSLTPFFRMRRDDKESAELLQAHLLLALANLSIRRGCNAVKAKEQSEQALALLRATILDENYQEIATSYNNIGTAQEMLGDAKAALVSHQKALGIRLKIYDAKHRSVAMSYHNIGRVQLTLGDPKAALEYHQKALAIYFETNELEHPDIAMTYSRLGDDYRNMGYFSLALEYYQKTLTLQLKIYGKIHLNVAISYHNLGLTHWMLGNFSKALEYEEKSLEIRLSIYGETHTDVAISYNNLSQYYNTIKDSKRALECQKKSLDTILKVHAINPHPDVAVIYNNLSDLYETMTDYSNALEWGQRSLEVLLKVDPKIIHPLFAVVYDRLANLYKKLKQLKKALKNYQKSLSVKIKIYEEGHPFIALTYRNMSDIYNALGNDEAALRCQEKASGQKTNKEDYLRKERLILLPIPIDQLVLGQHLTVEAQPLSYAITQYEPISHIIQRIQEDKEQAYRREVDKNGFGPVHYAVIAGRADLLSTKLFQGNLDWNTAYQENGIRPAHFAVLLERKRELEIILENRPIARQAALHYPVPILPPALCPVQAELTQTIELTPFHLAVYTGQTDSLDIFLKTKDESWEIPGLGNVFHLTVLGNQVPMLRILLSHFSGREKETWPFLEGHGPNKMTPLSYAAACNRPFVLQELLVHYLRNPDQHKKQDQLATVLAYGIRYGAVEAVQCLLEYDEHEYYKIEKQLPRDIEPLSASARARQVRRETVREGENRPRLIQIKLENHAQRKTAKLFTHPDFKKDAIGNLVFQGGGVKGIAYVGALKALSIQLKKKAEEKAEGISLPGEIARAEPGAEEKERKMLAEESNDFPSIHRVAGTSAGAITASLVALGFSVEAIDQLLRTAPFDQFIDGLDIEKFKQSGWFSKLHTLVNHLEPNRSIWKTLLGPMTWYQTIFGAEGFCRGDKLMSWLSEQIAYQLEIACRQNPMLRKMLPSSFLQDRGGIKILTVTLGDLQKLQVADARFKHLHIVAVRLPEKKGLEDKKASEADGSHIEVFNSEEPRYFDVLLIDAIRASMSIPGVFVPWQLSRRRSSDGRIVPPIESDPRYVDGGILKNYPIEHFDRFSYSLASAFAGGDADYTLRHRGTLGIKLYTPTDAKPPAEAPVTGIISFFKKKIRQGVDKIKSRALDLVIDHELIQLLKQVGECFWSAEDMIAEYQGVGESRTIRVSNEGIGTVDFALSREDQDKLVRAGQLAVEAFFGVRGPVVTVIEPLSSPVAASPLSDSVKEKQNKAVKRKPKKKKGSNRKENKEEKNPFNQSIQSPPSIEDASSSAVSLSAIAEEKEVKPLTGTHLGVTFTFKEMKIARDGDCGFTALNIKRDVLFVTLQSRSESKESRDMLAPEIEEFLRTRTQGTLADLQDDLKEISKTPRPHFQLLNAARASLLRGDPLVVTKKLFEAYAHVYRITKLESKLYLGYRAALLYAKHRFGNPINLYIWREPPVGSHLLTCIEHYPEGPDAADKPTVHMIHADHYTHYNALEQISRTSPLIISQPLRVRGERGLSTASIVGRMSSASRSSSSESPNNAIRRGKEKRPFQKIKSVPRMPAAGPSVSSADPYNSMEDRSILRAEANVDRAEAKEDVEAIVVGHAPIASDWAASLEQINVALSRPYSSDRKIEKSSMQEEAEKKLLEQKRVIVRIWRSGKNPDHRDSDVGHVSIETKIPNHYMSLWPKQHMAGEDGKPIMVGKRDEKSGKVELTPVFAKEVQLGGKFPLLPVRGKFVPSLELDCSFDYANRKPEVVYCFYTLDVSAIVSHFNSLKEKYKSWIIAPAFSVIDRDSSGSCASCAWELLLAGGVGKLISSQEQSVIASQGASQGAFQGIRSVPQGVYSFFARSAAGEAKSAGSLNSSFYSSEMAISLLVKSPDALQKLLESAKRKELQEKPLTQGIAFASETVVTLPDPENPRKKPIKKQSDSLTYDFSDKWGQLEKTLKEQIFGNLSKKYYRREGGNKMPSRSQRSEIDKTRSITQDGWVLSLARKVDVGNRQHVFMILEGINEGNCFAWYADLTTRGNQPPENKFSKINTEEIISIDFHEKLLPKIDKNTLQGTSFVAKIWNIDKIDAIRLKEGVENEKKDWEKNKTDIPYQLLGSEQKFPASSSKKGHNCFTWAREKINQLEVNEINVPISFLDWVGVLPSYHIPDSRKNQHSFWTPQKVAAVGVTGIAIGLATSRCTIL